MTASQIRDGVVIFVIFPIHFVGDLRFAPVYLVQSATVRYGKDDVELATTHTQEA